MAARRAILALVARSAKAPLQGYGITIASQFPLHIEAAQRNPSGALIWKPYFDERAGTNGLAFAFVSDFVVADLQVGVFERQLLQLVCC